MGVTDREIYAEIAPDLIRYANALIGPDQAPDVVSTVVTRALGRGGGLVGPESPKSYLMKAVLNEATGVNALMERDTRRICPPRRSCLVM
ncbi:MAG: hypothetical protein OEM32_07220 [Acidimicrobiia bacterium]|nr:hypothetical protein [Acidimicrobiia bacterium]